MSWEAVEFKLEEARFNLGEMGRDLRPAIARPKRRGHAASGTNPGALGARHWRPQFYYHFDGFLVAARSVPDIIQTWFGFDPPADNRPGLAQWVQHLPAGEEARRKHFRDSFRPLYEEFKMHPLSQARVVTVHHPGTLPVDVAVSAHWGIYKSGLTQFVPSGNVRPGPIGNGPAGSAPGISAPLLPLEPRPDQVYSIEPPAGTRPLFPMCEDYLKAAQGLVAEARMIAATVHGDQPLTPPPED
jgi:hypothetical protein